MNMELSPQGSPPQEFGDPKAEFRKPSGDAVNRKYRRRSPVDGSSSSSDDSRTRKRSSSPVSRRECADVSDGRRRKDDRRDLDRVHARGRYGRSDDFYGHSDRHSSRSSHKRHDEHDRHGKYGDGYERDNVKLSSRSGWNSRGTGYSDRSKQETEHRSRDSSRDSGRYSRDKCDSSGHRSKDKETDVSYTEFKKYKDKDASDKAASGRRPTSSSIEDTKSGDRDGLKEDRGARDFKPDHRRRSDAENYRKEGCKKYGNSDWYKDQDSTESREKVEGQESPKRKGQVSPAKKPKFCSADPGDGCGKDYQMQSSSSKQVSEKAYVTDSDIDAAKLAAMKAAELVNKNLVGTGYMSTDQKKKLLWGNKKNTTADETGHRWDSAMFDDREKQEKFNKLMGLKGDTKVENKPDNNAEKEKIQLDLEKQYTAGLRRRDGRTVGLGL